MPRSKQAGYCTINTVNINTGLITDRRPQPRPAIRDQARLALRDSVAHSVCKSWQDRVTLPNTALEASLNTGPNAIANGSHLCYHRFLQIR